MMTMMRMLTIVTVMTIKGDDGGDDGGDDDDDNDMIIEKQEILQQTITCKFSGILVLFYWNYCLTTLIIILFKI